MHLVGLKNLYREPLDQFAVCLKSIGEILGYVLLLPNNTEVDHQFKLVSRGSVTDHVIPHSKFVEKFQEEDSTGSAPGRAKRRLIGPLWRSTKPRPGTRSCKALLNARIVRHTTEVTKKVPYGPTPRVQLPVWEAQGTQKHEQTQDLSSLQQAFSKDNLAVFVVSF